MYELVRQYDAIRQITGHPEFNHITTGIMMVLDYLHVTLKEENVGMES